MRHIQTLSVLKNSQQMYCQPQHPVALIIRVIPEITVKDGLIMQKLILRCTPAKKISLLNYQF